MLLDLVAQRLHHLAEFVAVEGRMVRNEVADQTKRERIERNAGEKKLAHTDNMAFQTGARI
ncbi:MAG: hypothetical protein EOQ32_24720 [Mesorhizobium sp.]|nr:hypothetical protein EJ067_02090 [Mesorhizobium sp. M1D.F.Ca.ET.043.01.1.1]RWA87435.1 MAG: hypothetical protein EOQ32_24720 [Mesorhizobium sp.]